MCLYLRIEIIDFPKLVEQQVHLSGCKDPGLSEYIWVSFKSEGIFKYTLALFVVYEVY